MVSARVGQAGIIPRHHGRDLKFRHAALNGNGAVVGKLQFYLACGHTVDDIPQLLGVQHGFTGNQHIAFNGGGDADLHIIAGKSQLETFGF